MTAVVIGAGSGVIAILGIAVSWLAFRLTFRQTECRDVRDQLEASEKARAELQMRLNWSDGQNIELMRRLLKLNGGSEKA